MTERVWGIAAISARLAARKAFGQVRTYVAHVSGSPPPFLMVLDVPRHRMVWDRWSGRYGDYAVEVPTLSVGQYRFPVSIGAVGVSLRLRRAVS